MHLTWERPSLNSHPVGWLGQRGRHSVFRVQRITEAHARCAGARRAVARCAGVVRAFVVLLARCALRDRVLGVVPLNARYAGVISCRGGAFMPGAHEREWPARPTRRSSRPLRAQDRWFFDGQFGGALAAAERQTVERLGQRGRSSFFGCPCPLCRCSLCWRGSKARGADCPSCPA